MEELKVKNRDVKKISSPRLTENDEQRAVIERNK